MTSLTRLFALSALALGIAVTAPSPLVAAEGPLSTSVAADTLPDNKKTSVGLYVTAAEAAQVLAERDDVLMIDVRTPEETVLVGYATATDANIPLAVFDPSHSFNAQKSTYETKPNAEFARLAAGFLEGKEPAAVLVICRSGTRSVKAVELMLKAGVEVPLYSVVDGFEGDMSKAGLREVNGWKNAGAEWTYKAREGLLVTN